MESMLILSYMESEYQTEHTSTFFGLFLHRNRCADRVVN